jgi:DNA-binding CsgD family transcriptional regulator
VSPLHGRDLERDALGRLIGQAAEGGGGVVILEGAAGIGKTRLLAEAARIAAARGLEVASGAADELDQVTPWAPLLKALFSTSPPLLTEDDLAPLGGLMDQRLAVIESIRAALERGSRRRPLVLALDDLQWADPATLLALGSLPVQLFSYPIAWILARRPLPASAQLQGLTARLAEAGARRLHLRPLDEGAARALAADRLGAPPAPEVADLVARAAGNPLYIVELLRGATAAAGPPGEAGPAASVAPVVPPTLRSAVAAHLRSLPEPATDLLKSASVLGREFTVSELAAMTGQPTSQLLPALEHALLAEVLGEAGDRLAFRHDLLRQAVYQQVPGPLRQALHRDAAAALRRAGAPLARVAGQYAAGAKPGDEEAIEVLAAAAGQLSATARAAGADLAVRALGLLAEGDERRPQMTVTAVGLLTLAARIEQARDLAEGYLAGHRPPPQVEAAMLLGIRRAWTMRSLRPYPSPLPARLLDDPAVPAGIRASLLALEQIRAMSAGDFAGADQGFAAAMRLLADGGDAFDAAMVLILWDLNDSMRGDLSAGLERARGGLRDWSGPELKVALAVFEHDIAQFLGGLGRPREAQAALERALRAAEDCGFTLIRGMCQQRRAELLLEQGRLEDARAEARTSAAFAQEWGFHEVMGLAVAVLAETSIRLGDLSEARAAAERLRVLADDGGTALPERQWAQALCLEAEGRSEAALEALDPMFAQLSGGCLIFGARQADRLPWVVRLALKAGRRDRADLACAAAEALAGRNPDVGLFAALAAQARGLAGREPALLRRAADTLAGGEWPLAAAAASEDLGGVLAEAGAREPAIGELESAYAGYAGAGAHRDTARVRRKLRELGIRKRRPAVARPSEGWASLTDAELAVVAIVAEGSTNRETAARLYLSADTVNTHLRHAFTKLGIRSRVELARMVLSASASPGGAVP